MTGGWVYIMTNRPNGALYVGVTDDLARRAWEHRAGLIDGFTKQYGLKRLVFAERYDDMRLARQREQNIKHWPVQALAGEPALVWADPQHAPQDSCPRKRGPG